MKKDEEVKYFLIFNGLCSFCFGMWQQSLSSGLFAFFFIIILMVALNRRS